MLDGPLSIAPRVNQVPEVARSEKDRSDLGDGMGKQSCYGFDTFKPLIHGRRGCS